MYSKALVRWIKIQECFVLLTDIKFYHCDMTFFTLVKFFARKSTLHDTNIVIGNFFD